MTSPRSFEGNSLSIPRLSANLDLARSFLGVGMRHACLRVYVFVFCLWLIQVEADDASQSASPRMLLSQPRRPTRVPYYSPYDFMNCEGSNFSSSWRQFRLMVEKNSVLGFPQDDNLFREASRIRDEFQDVAQARSMLQVEVLLMMKPVAMLRDFCLYGFATALFILFRHDFNPNHLLDIRSLMGWGEWPLDFSEGSGWPTLWRIVPHHLERIEERGDASWSSAWKKWGDEEALMPNPRTDAVENVLLDWLETNRTLPQFLDGLSFSKLRPSLATRESLKVLVVGHHLGSSMEPFTMLQGAIWDNLGLRLDAQFHGQRHPSLTAVCEEFGYCNNNSKLQQWFRRYESRWVGEYEWMADSWPAALEDMAAAIKGNDFLTSTDFVVCGGPGWMCAMYRSVHVVPMLLYFAWPVVPMIPSELRSHFLWQIQALGQTVNPATVFVCANWILAAQFAYQVRLNVPVMRVHGLYVNQTYSPVPTPNGLHRVVFSRLGQWTGQAGPAFLEMAWALVKEEQKESKQAFPFELVFLSIRVRGVKPIFHATYAELAQFYACVFWPWDMMMMLFSELYTITMPLLVPDRHWMHDIIIHALKQTEVNWWHMRNASVAGILPSVSGKEFPLPFEPWMTDEPRLPEVAYWYRLTEFEQFPHVTHFRSLPDMLAKLQSLDVGSIRLGMRRFNQRSLRASRAFYADAASNLLS